MQKSDLQETLFSLYLRLNGYFVTGFVVHASEGNTTELDTLAVRFPNHKEPEREVDPCGILEVSNEKIDFLICEVKGGTKAANFNNALRKNKDAIRSVLNRIGAFENDDLDVVENEIEILMAPNKVSKSSTIPIVNVPGDKSQIRLILVVPDQVRPEKKPKSYIYGSDIIEYIWKCFRPENTREACCVVYNWNLWGEQYRKLVAYFKDNQRTEPGNMNNIYEHFGIQVP